MRYVNCTVTILNDHEVEYVEQGLDDRERELRGTLKADPLRLLTVSRLNYWINHAVATQQATPACALEDLKALGLHLYQLLFADDKIRQRFEHVYVEVQRQYKADPDTRLRLRVVFEPGTEQFAALPWEFLFLSIGDNLDTGVFVAGERTELLLTRRIAVPDLVQSLSPKGGARAARGSELRILLVTCQPTQIEGTQFAAVDEREVPEIIKTIEGLSATVRAVRVQPLPNPTYDQLKGQIGDFLPHIVHYVGHGSEGKVALKKAPDDPDYDIPRGGDQFRWVTSNQVKALFANQKPDEKPRLVFLNACKGAASETVDSFKSTARELVYAGILGVVAMQYSIANADAIRFAKRFYEEIGKGREIDEAVKMGRKVLGDLYPPWEHPRFATPVVYLQSSEPFVEATLVDAAATAGDAGGESGRRPQFATPVAADPWAAAPRQREGRPAAPDSAALSG